MSLSLTKKKETNRINFLSDHLIHYEEFVRCKLNDNMAVYHICDESEFITSDNPVMIRPFVNPNVSGFNSDFYSKKQINPFDSTNMIHLPIDNKTILTILPNSNEPISDFFEHSDIGIIDVILYNSDIEKNAENWLLGTKTGLESHSIDQKKYNEINESNLEIIENYKSRTIGYMQLLDLLKVHGPKNHLVKSKLEEMKKNKYIAADTNFITLIEQIELAN